jgi:MYXO-CTERM domain-containing protein
VLTLLLAFTPPSFACSFATGEPHSVVENPEDTASPTAPGSVTALVTRGVAPVCNVLGMCQSTSCDDLGRISLSFPASEDAVSAANAVGYRLRVVEGAPPDDLGIDETRRADSIDADQASLMLIWIDEATDDQEAFSVVIGITAVDEAGNESEEVTIEVSDPGSEAGGCNTAGGGAGMFALVLAAAFGARRQNR